jgi:signal transduction histidine kinase/ActR/RegA family two-component response regulator/HAMP domain-containing protein
MLVVDWWNESRRRGSLRTCLNAEMSTSREREKSIVQLPIMQLILLPIIPALALAIYSSFEQRRDGIRNAEEKGILVARLAAAEQERLTLTTREILAPLAESALLRSTPARIWNSHFKNLLLLQPAYQNFGLVDTNGILMACANATNAPTNFVDSHFFSRVLRTAKFAFGNFEPANGPNGSISFGYPVLETGRVTRVFFATMGLDVLRDRLSEIKLPAYANLYLVDQFGASIHCNAGPPLSLPNLLFGVMTNRLEAAVELPNPNGGRMVYAFTSLKHGRQPGPFAVVALPVEALSAPANARLYRNVSILGVAALFAILGAQHYARKHVIRPLGILAAGAERLSKGDLSVRIPVEPSGRLHPLSRAFDEMAVSLGKEREYADALLRLSRKLQGAESWSEIIQVAREEIHGTLGFTRVWLYVFSEDRKTLRLEFADDPPDGQQAPAERMELTVQGDLMLQEIASSKDIVVVEDAARDPRTNKELVAKLKIRTIIHVPIAFSGNRLATLATGTFAPEGIRKLSQPEAKFLVAVGSHVAAVIDRVVSAEERVKAETALRKREVELRQAQKLDAIGTLAGGIAHDFNNILSAITGYTELARMELSDNAYALSHLAAVTQAADRATELVRQILSFSRKREQERKVIQLRHVVAEAVKLLRATIPTTIKFETDLAPDAPTVLADSTQVHQIIMNLGTNALHAMKGSAGTLGIKLESFTVDESVAATNPQLHPGLYARLSVSDTGHGMDCATLDRVFEPFFTTKAPGEGTGLGLSVVHGIVQNHEGAIAVYSQPEEGTVFHVYLPAHGASAEPGERDLERVPQGNGERILFIDDEPALAELGKCIVETLGYRVRSTTDPLDALNAFQMDPNQFDLVITDYTMPNLTGVELARKLSEIRPGVAVILATGYTATMTTEAFRGVGISNVLMKPLSIARLSQAIEDALKGNGASQK